jgi:pimeloyl-ACP methyl ester carboxylesterase
VVHVLMDKNSGKAVFRLAACALLVLLLLSFSGCGTQIGTRKASFQEAYGQINANAVTGEQYSVSSQNVLYRHNMAELFLADPEGTLLFLHQRAKEDNRRDLLLALSELSYFTARQFQKSRAEGNFQKGARYYLGAAVYAYFYLFDQERDVPAEIYSTDFRLACELYNASLAQAMTTPKGDLHIAGGVRDLPKGHIQLQLGLENFPELPEQFETFLASDRMAVFGLSRRNRDSGLGAPFVAVRPQMAGESIQRSMPGTLFLRVKTTFSEAGLQDLKGSLELYSAYEINEMEVNHQTVPLGGDTTAQLAYNLNQSLLWDIGLLEFRTGRQRIKNGIYRPIPFSTKRIPVVLVHGTVSSPAWWAEMLNTLNADPTIRRNFQFWMFIYDSGKPTVLSAIELREALQETIQKLDPEADDAALQQMVIIGHSQGGLLTKLTATNTGDALLYAATGKRLDELDLTQEQVRKLHGSIIIDALPFVKRVVFISTPHRGSFLARGWVRYLVRKIVSLPVDIINKTNTLFAGLRDVTNDEKWLADIENRTSIDSMSPDNPGLLALAEIPLAPGIKGHSIIAVEGNDDIVEGDDGVVGYNSAHVDYVESELVVHSAHSCQDKPATIEEVRRILLKHLTELPKGFSTAKPIP